MCVYMYVYMYIILFLINMSLIVSICILARGRSLSWHQHWIISSVVYIVLDLIVFQTSGVLITSFMIPNMSRAVVMAAKQVLIDIINASNHSNHRNVMANKIMGKSSSFGNSSQLSTYEPNPKPNFSPNPNP